MPSTMPTTPCRFDFAAAVAAARQMYPVETAPITFIDKTDRNAASRLATWLVSTSPDFQRAFLQNTPAKAYAAHSVGTGGSFAEIDPITGRGVLVLGHSGPSYYDGLTSDDVRWQVFMHELGHIVVPSGMYRDIDGLRLWQERSDYWQSIAQTHMWETAADVFSYLHNLKSGQLTVPQINTLTLNDAWRVYTDPSSASALEHMTMPGGDAVIIAAKDIDFVSLTPAQITAIAEQHAHDFAFTPAQAANLYEDVAALQPRLLAPRLHMLFNASTRLPDTAYSATFFRRLRDGVANGDLSVPFTSPRQIAAARKAARR